MAMELGLALKAAANFSFRHSQGALCLDPFRDVVSHASHDGSRHTVGSKCASKLPHASLAGAGHDGQEPSCNPVSPEVGNVRIEPVSGIRREQLRNGHTRELVRRVPQNPSRRVVDREKSTLEVMGGNQVFTVLDQVAIPVFAVSKRLFDSTAFADFRLKDGVLVEGLTLAAGDSPRAPVCDRVKSSTRRRTIPRQMPYALTTSTRKRSGRKAASSLKMAAKGAAAPATSRPVAATPYTA